MYIDRIKKARTRRKLRVRHKVFGTADRPRLSVFRSGRHMYAQLIDDVAGVTLASAGTLSKNIRSDMAGATGSKAAAEAVGSAIAKQALGVGIKYVCFDRNRYRYHGRVRSLAETARKTGLVF